MPPLSDLDLDADDRATLARVHGIEDCHALAQALAFHRLDEEPGFGPARRRALLDALRKTHWEDDTRDLLHARQVAVRVLSRIQQDPNALRLAPVSGVRRMSAAVDRVDLIGTAHDPDALADAFRSLPFLEAAPDEGPYRVGRTEDGTRVRLLVLPESPPEVAWALLRETGPAEHVRALADRAAARGLDVSEDGLRRDGERLAIFDEAQIYQQLELPYIPPECRDASLAPAPEGLLGMPEMRGLYRARSKAGGGDAPVEHLARRAEQEGYAYVVIADPWRPTEGEAPLPVEGVIQAGLLGGDATRWPHTPDAWASRSLWIVDAAEEPETDFSALVRRVLDTPQIGVLAAPSAHGAGAGLSLDAYAEAAARGLALECAPYPHRRAWDAPGLARFQEAGGRLLPSAEIFALGHEERALVAVAAARRLRWTREAVPLTGDAAAFVASCTREPSA